MSAFKTVLVATVGDFDLHETTDRQRSLFVTPTGEKGVIASAWGPAADGTGEWFASLWPNDPVRVAGRDAAIAHITSSKETTR